MGGHEFFKGRVSGDSGGEIGAGVLGVLLEDVNVVAEPF